MARACNWDLHRRRNSRREDNWTPTISAGGCWCGEEYGHDWPGKADGAAHPKPGENLTPGPVGCQPADCCGEPEKHLTGCEPCCEYTVVDWGDLASVFACSNKEPHNSPQECTLSYVGRVD